MAVAALLVFSGLKYAAVRQRLLAQRTAIDNQWTGVENAMQRRADLISTRAAGLKSLSGETAEVTGNIAQARASLVASRTPREKMAAYGGLDQAIAHLLAMVQKDRKGRTGTRLSHLPDDISNTENEVNVARQKYNEALETYNTMLQLFPNNIVAAVSGFTRNDAYIQTGTGAVHGAKVQF
jgi:LemA protein